MGKQAFLKLFEYESVLERGLGGALGMHGGGLPLPTRPQRYCDPMSLVQWLPAYNRIVCRRVVFKSL